MDGVRFYGTSLFIAFDEDETSSFKPSLHLIDFERAKLDAETDGSSCLSPEEIQKIFMVNVTAQRVVSETDKVQGSGGGPSSIPPRNDTDQQAVDMSLLRDTGPDLYMLRSLKYVFSPSLPLPCILLTLPPPKYRHLLAIVQDEWSLEEHIQFNPGYNPHVIWRQSKAVGNGVVAVSTTTCSKRSGRRKHLMLKFLVASKAVASTPHIDLFGQAWREIRLHRRLVGKAGRVSPRFPPVTNWRDASTRPCRPSCECSTSDDRKYQTDPLLQLTSSHKT